MSAQQDRVGLPQLTVSWSKGRAHGVRIAKGVFPPGNGLTVATSNFRPQPVLRETADRAVIVVGSPIPDDRVDSTATAEAFLRVPLRREDEETFLRRLNGQFLLLRLDKTEGRLTVAGDRFNGVPLYWADLSDRFVASILYCDLFRILRQEPGFGVRAEHMLEFIWLQRLLFDKTYDTLSRFLLPASRLEVGRSEPILTRYWRPDFTKARYRSTRESGALFTEYLQQSVRRRTRDRKRFGLFLSGGHDSRTILAAFETPPICFTVAFSDNYEVACARRAAQAVGAPHRFLQLDDDHFVRFQDDMARLCGGMYGTDNALFVGLREAVAAEADVLFHGHGFDYLFQGMYLPSRTITLFGRPTFFRRLRPLGPDIVDDFLNGVPFRLQNVGLMAFVQKEERDRMAARIRASVAEVLKDGEDICQTDFDRWEYLIVHALGRHYSHPNIASKMTCGEQRTVSFDNDLFDFYCALPHEHRLSAQTMRYAMKHLAPRLARIPTGNWGIAAGSSPIYKTAHLIGRKLLRHLTGIQSLRAPNADDRTWPDRDRYLVGHADYQALVREAVGSDMLADALPYFDWPKLRQAAETWMARPSGGAKFLVSLMTLHRFLLLSR